MTAVILASRSTDLARRLRLASGDDLTVISPEQVPAGPAQLLALVDQPDDVRSVVLDVCPGSVAPEQALGLAQRFDRQHPNVSVLVATDSAQELALPALRSGVRDIVEFDASVDDLRAVLRHAAEAGATRRPVSADQNRFTGRVVTVASPKGGVGKTTVATNLAVGLAEQSPQGTVLVDLDVQFGDVAAALDMEPDYTVGDVIAGRGLQDSITLKALLTRHRTGLQVLPGVRTPVDADHVTAGVIGELLELLKAEFRFVVVDTAPGLSEQTLAAIDHTTDLVLVSGLDVPGVRGLRKELQVLDELPLPPMTRHIVVNFADPGGGLSVKDVEATIGQDVDVVIPRSAKVVRATNQGVPLLELKGKDRVSKDLLALVSRFSPVAANSSRWTGRHRGWMSK